MTSRLRFGAAFPEKPCALLENPPDTPTPGAAEINEQMYVMSQELNKMTLLLISPRPECVFIFFVVLSKMFKIPTNFIF